MPVDLSVADLENLMLPSSFTPTGAQNAATPQTRPVPAQDTPPLATEISNRWMLGWPQATKELLKSGRYLEALKAQEQQEREVLSEPGNSHLARHEIVQEFGLSLSPPTF